MTSGLRTWSFLSSHGLLLVEVARDPDATVRELSERAGLTERQAHRVLADLVAEGFLVRERVGRRNRYLLDTKRKMRHPSLRSHPIGDLLAALAQGG